MQDPVYYWDPVIAPSGLAFYTGRLFGEWRESLFVGGLRSMGLVRLKLANDKVVEEEPLLTELRSRIRDVRVGPDGYGEYPPDQQAVETHTEVTSCENPAFRSWSRESTHVTLGRSSGTAKSAVMRASFLAVAPRS
jgi:hypothetical protein